MCFYPTWCCLATLLPVCLQGSSWPHYWQNYWLHLSPLSLFPHLFLASGIVTTCLLWKRPLTLPWMGICSLHLFWAHVAVTTIANFSIASPLSLPSRGFDVSSRTSAFTLAVKWHIVWSMELTHLYTLPHWHSSCVFPVLELKGDVRVSWSHQFLLLSLIFTITFPLLFLCSPRLEAWDSLIWFLLSP